ncbi:hypothetical protein [Rubripirellula reticaptiva]|uniref:Uncharacterized protein n=1 Tax=Rubripirellula reticaptiva TaxID=2528013 RepID=A0A5C6ET13_9BACT|nr:hypothetical protein [Rubripirellula reticaptiva]TWU51217.1 hypothetical protein Poly59_28080 [Rubripirellula reticaptiva]
MNPILDIKCPKCALPLRLQRPSGPSEVTCPKCHNQIGLTAQGTITAARKLDDFANLPAPISATSAPARPKNLRPVAPPRPKPVAGVPKPPAGTFQPSVRPATHNPSSGKWVKQLIVPAICVLITLGAGIGVYSMRDSIPINKILPIKSIVASLPMMDSHESVLADYVDVGKSTSDLFTALKEPGTSLDPAAIATAVETLKAQNERCDQIRRRAINLPTTSPDQWASLMEWLKAQAPDKTKQTETPEVTNVARQQLAASTALRDASMELMGKMQDVRSTIESAWLPTPEPQNPLQTIEYGAIMAKRKVWKAVMTADSASDYQAISSAMSAAADDLAELTDQFKTIEKPDRMFRAFSPYFGHSMSYDADIAFRLIDLANEHGPLDDAAAQKRYVGNMESLMAVGKQDVFADMNRMTPDNGSPQNSFGGPPQGFQRNRGNVDDWLARTTQNIRRQHTKDKTVLLRIDDRVDGAAGDALIDGLKKSLDIRRSIGFGFGDTSLIALFDSRSPESVAAAIDWAEVINIDSNERLIHVKMKP